MGNGSKIPHPQLSWMNGTDWRVVEDFEWSSVCVPAGFITDGASIPRIVHTWARPTGPNFPSALIHDYRYRLQMGNRKDADDEFYYNLRILGLRWSKAFLMYLFVRTFGYFAWKNNTPRIEDVKDQIAAYQKEREQHENG
jgi:hypothetical protein